MPSKHSDRTCDLQARSSATRVFNRSQRASARLRGGVVILALTLVGCASQQSSFDPALCQSTVSQGGSSTTYSKCLLGQARGKTVGGMPVLSERARLSLQDEEDDPCRAMQNATTADLLVCEMSRPSKPAPLAGSRVSSGETPPLPLVVMPAQ